MAEEELHHYLARLDLRAQTPESGLVGIGRRAEHQLLAELLGHPLLEAKNGLLVDPFFARMKKAQRGAKLFLGMRLHPDKQSATTFLRARPRLDQRIEELPAAKIEIADAKVRPRRQLQRILKGGKQGKVDVVEDSGHNLSSWRTGKVSARGMSMLQNLSIGNLGCCRKGQTAHHWSS